MSENEVAFFFYFSEKDVKMQCRLMLLLPHDYYFTGVRFCVCRRFFVFEKSITCWRHQWIHTILLTRQMKLGAFYPCRFFALHWGCFSRRSYLPLCSRDRVRFSTKDNRVALDLCQKNPIWIRYQILTFLFGFN